MVDGEVIHFISRLWSHQGSNDDGTVGIMRDRVLELICISLSSFLLSQTGHKVMEHLHFSAFILNGAWLFVYVPVCAYIFSGKLAHFTCFLWLKITPRDAVCTY